jgi:hypothetical protein
MDPIPIADEVVRSLIPRKCLRSLACNPFCRRICCDVDPDEVSAAEPDDDEGIELVKTDRCNNEQVHGVQCPARGYARTFAIPGWAVCRWHEADVPKDLPLVITVCVGTIGLFVTVAERALIERGMEDGARKVVSYLPNNLHQAND